MFFLKINTITSSLANDLIFGLALGFLKNNKSLMKKPYKYTDLAFNSDFKLQRQEREEESERVRVKQSRQSKSNYGGGCVCCLVFDGGGG